MNRNNLWLDACVFNCAMACQALWDRFLNTYDQIMEQDLPVEQLTHKVNVELDKVHKKMAEQWVGYKDIYDNPNKLSAKFKDDLVNNLPENAVF